MCENRSPDQEKGPYIENLEEVVEMARKFECCPHCGNWNLKSDHYCDECEKRISTPARADHFATFLERLLESVRKDKDELEYYYINKEGEKLRAYPLFYKTDTKLVRFSDYFCLEKGGIVTGDQVYDENGKNQNNLIDQDDIDWDDFESERPGVDDEMS